MEAYDDGTPKRANTLDITVNVRDINDNSPIFNPKQKELSLSELSPLLTEFGFVSATDADGGQNGKIYYNIQENQTAFGECEINASVQHSTSLCVLYHNTARYSNLAVLLIF